MRKFLVIGIPIIILTSFVLIMFSCNFLKNTLGKDDNFSEKIQLILKDVELENWENANINTEKLSNSWKNTIKRIQFSSEIDEISSIDACIARLRGAIMAKDKSSSFMELNEAYEHWEGLGK